MSETLRQAAQAVLDRWDSPQWEWRKHGPTADLMADLRAALAQPAAPDAPLVAGQVIAGAVYDLMGYLTTLDKSISLGSSELAAPASDALSAWAMKRGLSLDEPDIENWHKHIAAPDVQPVAWIDKHGNIDRGLDAILSPDGWVPLYAAAQAAQPAPQPLTPDVVRDMLDDTREVFDASGPETPQVVRCVIEYVESWLAVYADKRGITATAAPKEPQ